MSKYQLTVAFDSMAELEEFVAHKAGRRDAPQVHHVTVGVIDQLDNPSAGTVSADEKVSVAAAAAFAPPASRTETIGFGVTSDTRLMTEVPAAPAPVSAAPFAPTPPTVATAPAPVSAAPFAPTPPTVATAPIVVLSPAAAVPGGVAQGDEAVAPAGVALDSKGLPWDARIHAESKNKIADGSWRQRRNLDATVKATVEAELRSLLALNAGAAVPAPLAPPAPAAPAASVVPPPLPPVTVAAPPAPPSPVPAPAPVPTASPSDNRESPAGQLMVKIAPLMADGRLPLATVIEVCKRHGIDNLSQAVMVPNLVPAIEADLMAAVA